MSNIEKNKAPVTAFYDLMLNHCKPAEGVEKYVGELYIQHNPGGQTASKDSSNISPEWRRSIPESACNSSAR